MIKNINTPEYWDKRYSNKNYETMYRTSAQKILWDKALKIIARRIDDSWDTVNILELGCGLPVIPWLLKEYYKESDIVNTEGFGMPKKYTYTGIDHSNQALTIGLNDFPDWEFFNQDLNDYFAGNIRINSKFSSEFDIILCLETMEHCISNENILIQIKELLKSNGIALISVPMGLRKLSCHVQEYATTKYFADLVKIIGHPEISIVGRRWYFALVGKNG